MEYNNISMIGDTTSVRYLLEKKDESMLYVIGVNPSTADEEKPDPTIRKVMGFAERNGFDGFAMFNIYPQRTTNPSNLHQECNVEWHKKNLSIFKTTLGNIQQPVILLAYGNAIEKRSYLKDCLCDILNLLQPLHPQWKQLGTPTKLGHPRHPLYSHYGQLNDYKVIPLEITTEMKRQGCNHVNYVGISDGKEVYAIEEVDKNGRPIPTGLPVLLTWDGKRVKTIVGHEALNLLSIFE